MIINRPTLDVARVPAPLERIARAANLSVSSGELNITVRDIAPIRPEPGFCEEGDWFVGTITEELPENDQRLAFGQRIVFRHENVFTAFVKE